MDSAKHGKSTRVQFGNLKVSSCANMILSNRSYGLKRLHDIFNYVSNLQKFSNTYIVEFGSSLLALPTNLIPHKIMILGGIKFVGRANDEDPNSTLYKCINIYSFQPIKLQNVFDVTFFIVLKEGDFRCLLCG